MGILDRLDAADRKLGLDRVIPYIPWIVGTVVAMGVVLAAITGEWKRAVLGLVMLPLFVWTSWQAVQQNRPPGSN